VYKAFPRRGERDPWKVLGVARDATGDEVSVARDWLLEEYNLDPEGCEAIEIAHDKVIAASFQARLRTGINKKKQQRKQEKKQEKQREKYVDVESRVGAATLDEPEDDRPAAKYLEEEVPPKALLLNTVLLAGFLSVGVNVLQSVPKSYSMVVIVAALVFGIILGLKRKAKLEGSEEENNWLYPSFGATLLSMVAAQFAGYFLSSLFAGLRAMDVLVRLCPIIGAWFAATYLR